MTRACFGMAVLSVAQAVADPLAGQLLAYAKAKRHRLYPAFRLVLVVGMRRGEVAGALWAELSWATGRLDIGTQLVQMGWKVAESDPKTASPDA